ncbi:MAG: hypothetical protein VX335_00965 [Pseudomonadota bacterium]|nr:hypothetical protein [Pseudomonadota bacterium]
MCANITKSKIFITIAVLVLATVTHASVGPLVKNDTNCSLELNIESTCKGNVVAKVTINENEKYIIPDKFEEESIQQNQKFCLTIKPSCEDDVLQTIQTVAPYFNESCLINFRIDDNSKKTLDLNKYCTESDNHEVKKTS